MRVVVTGAAGFIGSYLVQALTDRGDECVCIDSFADLVYDSEMKRDRFSTFNPAFNPAFNPSSRVLTRDIRTQYECVHLVGAVKPDAIVHLAAHPGVGPSALNPSGYTTTNVVGTSNILQAASPHVPRVVIASSSSVYGSNGGRASSEDSTPCHPESVYAATKRSAELITDVWSQTHPDQTFVTVRPFTVYGPWGRPDMAVLRWAVAAASGLPIPFHGVHVERDFTYVTDVVDILVAALDAPLSTGHHVVNAGYGTPHSTEDVLTLIGEHSPHDVEIGSYDRATGDMGRTHASTKKLAALGLPVPQIGLEQGIGVTMDWVSSLDSTQLARLRRWTRQE